MAPRRHAGNSHSLLEIAGNDETQMENLVNHQQLTSSSNNSSNTSNNNNSSNSTCSSNINNNNNNNNNVARCCAPSGECLRANALIRSNSLQDVVKVICNNETCPMGQYMHRECFDAWEQTLLTYLKNCGRARSWSERQRHQNLWTKKGYDLAFKACGCRCGRGHLKKDLDWIPPVGFGSLTGTRAEEIETKKKKRRNRQNTRPSLAVSAGPPSANHNGHVNIRSGNVSEAQMIESLRGRAGSLSSSNGSSSPPATSETSISPLHLPQAIVKKKTKVDFFGETRIRQSCGANGIFSRRLDFSAFNSLPRTKLNSYHIKMEDEGNHGMTIQGVSSCQRWLLCSGHVSPAFLSRGDASLR